MPVVFNPFTGNLDLIDNTAAAGSDTQVQFNDGGVLGGDSGLVFNKTTNALTGGAFIPTSSTVPANGVYLPSTNTVAVSTNGAGRLFISDDGKIGIGTATPSAYAIQADDLVIAPSTSTAGISLVATAGSLIYFSDLDAEGRGVINYNHGDDSFRFSTAASQRLVITSNGDVNIVGAGTAGVTQAVSFNGSAPVDSLVVNSSGNVSTAGTMTAGSFIPTSSTVPANGVYLPGTNQLALSTNGTGRLFVDAAGNVGIGTSSPSYRLHAVAASEQTNPESDSGAYWPLLNSSSTLNTCSALALGTNNDLGTAIVAQRVGANNEHVIKFQTRNSSGSLGTRMTLTGSGSLGIGTTSPSAKLTVVEGTANTSMLNLVGLNNYIHEFQNRDAGNHLRFYINSGSPTWSWASNATEFARIDSSGRLLVGTSSERTVEYAPGTAGTPKLQVEGSDGGTSQILITDTRLDGRHPQLAFAKTRNGAIVVSGDTLGSIGFFGDDGTDTRTWGGRITCEVDGTPGVNDMPGRLVFSVTADGASSPTERMRIGNKGHIYATCSDTALASLTLRKGDASADGVDYIQARNTANSLRFVAYANGGIGNYQANDVNLSDRNAKKDITPAVGTWDCIKEWEIVNYRYKDQPADADLNLGVIAQQVAESCPEVVTVFEEAKDDQPEKLGVKEQQMMWMAIKALQEAQTRIETLEAEVAALKAQ